MYYNPAGLLFCKTVNLFVVVFKIMITILICFGNNASLLFPVSQQLLCIRQLTISEKYENMDKELKKKKVFFHPFRMYCLPVIAQLFLQHICRVPQITEPNAYNMSALHSDRVPQRITCKKHVIAKYNLQHPDQEDAFAIRPNL